MNKKSASLLLAYLSLIFACAGCGHTPGTDSPGTVPVNVQVQKATPVDGSHTIAYSGTIEESESIPLSFAVVGTVSRVLVAEGDNVKKGQPLATLNDESYRNTFAMSEASRKQAEDAYKRLQPMYKNGTLPEVKLVEVETNLEKARSAAMIAKKNVSDCVLYSPADGIVGRRSVEPGMTAMPNLTSITIVKTGKVYARIAVSEHEISSMHKGQKANIVIAALNDAQYTGTVQEIGVVADPLAHTYRVRIAVANGNLVIRPGMICNVRIHQPALSHGLMVVGPAVMVDEASRAYVYAVDTTRGTATRRYVRTGALLLDGIEITDGLEPNTLVVVSGQHKLVDGAAVRIVKD